MFEFHFPIQRMFFVEFDQFDKTLKLRCANGVQPSFPKDLAVFDFTFGSEVKHKKCKWTNFPHQIWNNSFPWNNSILFRPFSARCTYMHPAYSYCTSRLKKVGLNVAVPERNCVFRITFLPHQKWSLSRGSFQHIFSLGSLQIGMKPPVVRNYVRIERNNNYLNLTKNDSINTVFKFNSTYSFSRCALGCLKEKKSIVILVLYTSYNFYNDFPK